MTRWRFWWLLALAGVAAAALAMIILLRPLPVEVARPVADVPIQVFGLGTVEARILARIGFEVGATLVELHADHGDRVSKGDILAQLHSAEQVARVARAAAGLVNAEAAVRKAEAGVGRARAVLAQKKEANKRRQALLARQTASAEAAEEAQMEENVATAELAVATSEVEVTKAALDDARAQHELEQALLANHTLLAPFDALVVRRHREAGSVLAPGEVLFTLVAPESVWVLAHVDEARAGDLRLDQPAEVRLRSLPRETLQGRVARIDIESDRVSEERRIYIACERCPASIYLGEQAEVLVTTASLERPLLVPETAITGFDGARGTVWTVESGELHRRKVELGRRTLDSSIELTGGLPAGAEVVTVLRPGLREGRAATVMAAP